MKTYERSTSVPGFGPGLAPEWVVRELRTHVPVFFVNGSRVVWSAKLLPGLVMTTRGEGGPVRMTFGDESVIVYPAVIATARP